MDKFHDLRHTERGRRPSTSESPKSRNSRDSQDNPPLNPFPHIPTTGAKQALSAHSRPPQLIRKPPHVGVSFPAL
jgi:hypothetical protein